jgi:bacterioferritin-associated ferredoxin
MTPETADWKHPARSQSQSVNIDMNHTHQDRREDIVCRCSGTTRTQIRRLIESGVDDLEGISRATGTCSGCGACDTDILELLAE